MPQVAQMVPANSSQQPSRRPYRAGLGALASKLGVTRNHVYRVATGRRQSQRISNHPEFRAWLAKQSAANRS